MTEVVKEMIDWDIRMLCEWKNCEIEEMNVQQDHIHLIVSIPPKVSVSEFAGTIKGKLAIRLFKSYPQLKKRPYWGNHFWARGYFVNTIGINEEMIKRYVKYQEDEERREENQGKDFGLFESI
jgi:putative transposase